MDMLAAARTSWEALAEQLGISILPRVQPGEWARVVLGTKIGSESDHVKALAQQYATASYPYHSFSSQDECDATAIGVYAHIKEGWTLQGIDHRLVS